MPTAPCMWRRRRNRGPAGFTALLRATESICWERYWHGVGSLFCQHNSSITFFSEKRKWDPNKGLRQKLFYPNFLIATQYWRRGTIHSSRDSEASTKLTTPSRETLFPLWTAHVLCLNQGRTRALQYKLSSPLSFTALGPPTVETAGIQPLVWIILPPSGCSGQSKTDERGKSQTGLFPVVTKWLIKYSSIQSRCLFTQVADSFLL